ncbi:MAG: cytidine deaminase [Patescibacteria group bacterium]
MEVAVQYDRLSILQQKLLRGAESALEKAYCPYSHFAVGAAIATPEEKIFYGANVENASFGLTICAERVAICNAVVAGETRFSDLAIIAKSNGFGTKDVTAPCGMCRQVLYEFASLHDQELTILLATLHLRKIVMVRLSDLLPQAFGPRDLGFNAKP